MENSDDKKQRQSIPLYPDCIQPKKGDLTTIKLKKATKDKIDKFKIIYNETYASVLDRLIIELENLKEKK